VAAVVDVETTGTNPDRDKIIEFGICLFEYDRQNGRSPVDQLAAYKSAPRPIGLAAQIIFATFPVIQIWRR
jgi:DNA polymerase III epsilon subunit-like protein